MANEQGTYSVFKSFVNSSNSNLNNSNLTPTPLPAFNETIQFGGDSKTYKELIYTSRVRKTLNLPIEILTNDSDTSRLAERNRKKGTNVIPRPQNPWIIYRRDKYASSEFDGIKSCVASGPIGERWRKESKEVLEYFIALSMLALENHQKKYGNYKYKPKQRISKMCKKSKNRQSENVENISPVTMISLIEETTFNKDLPQLTVIPSSPINEYLPTPASSIQHSPLTFQDELFDQYPSTPASSNHHSPLTIQDEILDQYFPTPVSSNNQSPSSEISYLPNPTSSNQHMITTFEELLSIDPTVMYPQFSEITPTNDFSAYNDILLTTSENDAEFLFNADMLAALPSLLDPTTTNMITTNMEEPIQDFELYPEDEAALISNATPPTAETTINMENQQPIMYNLFEYDSYDPFSINSATLFPDQLDHYGTSL